MTLHVKLTMKTYLLKKKENPNNLCASSHRRGFSGNNNTSQIANESSKLSTSSTLGSATKRSLKLIEKATPNSNHNFQVLRLSSGINQADFGSFAVFDTTTTANTNNPTTTMSQSISSSRSRKNSNNTSTNSNNQIRNSKADYNTESTLNFTSSASSNGNNNNNQASDTSSNQTYSTPNYNSGYINRSHTNTNSTINWNEESNSGWTGTGVMSDRSSVYSIDDGDFDREASRRVNNQLREIESILYEQNSAHSKNSITECNEWLEKFPHIRVLGKQILTSRSESDSQSSLENLRSSLQSSLRSLTS